MPFWLIAVLIIASIVLGELLRPKVRDNSRPASLKDFDAPTADSTRAIPVVWGTVLLDNPNLCWYGDLQTVKLTKKVRTGLFSTDRLTLGYRYSIGMHLVLCHGPIDSLLEFRADNKIAFSSTTITDPTSLGQDFTVDARIIYGGDSEEQLQNGGEGGIYATCKFYKGSPIQEGNAYFEGILATDLPGYRDVSYIMWNGPSSGDKVYNYALNDPTEVFTREPFLSGYIGDNPTLKPFSFVIKRTPNMLSAGDNLFFNIGGDANPADVIYELFTNDRWGAGISPSLIETNSFKIAQETLFNEGIGFSAIWDTPRQINEIVDDILSYIDGVIYTDLVTGLITLKLARADYDPSSLTLFDKDNVTEITSYSRTSWDETTNEVRVNFTDRFDNFKDKPSIAQDLANQRIQGATVSSNISYVGISNKDTATKIAFRDLRSLTIPLAKVTLKINRRGITLRPGDVFKLVWEEYDLDQTILRTARIGYGEFDKGIIEVEAIQDVFSLSTPLYTSPPNSGWTNPVGSPSAPTGFETVESPYLFSSDNHKIEAFCARPDINQLSFNTYTSPNNSTGTYTQVDTGDAFTPTALLDSSYPLITSDVSATNMVVTASTPDMLTFLKNFNPVYIQAGENLFWITDGTNKELCAFESVLPNTPSAGKYTLQNIWRGLGDTVHVAHAAGSRLWFFTYGEGFPSQIYNAGDTIYTKFQALAGTTSSSLSAFDSVAISRRSLKPYPPGKFQINGSTSTVNISDGSDIVVAWEHRNRVFQGETLYKQFTTGILPEAATEYYLKFFNATNTLLRTVGPLTTTTYTYLNTDQVADNSATEPKVVTVQLYSKRDGLFSFVPQQRTLLRPTGSAPASPVFTPGSDTYDPPLPGSASSLNDIPICSSTPTQGQGIIYDSTAQCYKHVNLETIAIEFIMDGGGSTISIGEKGHLEIPFSCIIERWTLVTNQSGSIVIDIWKDTFANTPPTVADSITASAKPTITSATKAQSSTLTGWTTTISAGDVLAYNIDSITDIQRVVLSLKARRI